jgi:riboflavin kinase/FMN adenylyltransferase
VDFVERLRDEIKFSGIEELVEQINQDITDAKEILAPHFSG